MDIHNFYRYKRLSNRFRYYYKGNDIFIDYICMSLSILFILMRNCFVFKFYSRLFYALIYAEELFTHIIIHIFSHCILMKKLFYIIQVIVVFFFFKLFGSIMHYCENYFFFPRLFYYLFVFLVNFYCVPIYFIL